MRIAELNPSHAAWFPPAAVNLAEMQDVEWSSRCRSAPWQMYRRPTRSHAPRPAGIAPSIARSHRFQILGRRSFRSGSVIPLRANDRWTADFDGAGWTPLRASSCASRRSPNRVSPDAARATELRFEPASAPDLVAAARHVADIRKAMVYREDIRRHHNAAPQRRRQRWHVNRQDHHHRLGIGY